MMAIILLSGTGIGSVQAQDTTPQTWTLRQCIDYAIEHNIDIRQTANEAEQNKISVNTAKWARLPNLNGGISQGWSWGRTASPKDNSYSDTNSSSTGVNLSTNVPLFTGLQLSNQYSLAKLNLQAAIEDLNKAKEDIAINVTSAYLQVLFNLELNKVAQNQVELSKDQLKRIKGLHDVDVMGNLKIGYNGIAKALHFNVMAVVRADGDGGVDDVRDHVHDLAQLVLGLGLLLFKLRAALVVGLDLGVVFINLLLQFRFLRLIRFFQLAIKRTVCLRQLVAGSLQLLAFLLRRTLLRVEPDGLVYERQLCILKLFPDIFADCVRIFP